MAIEKEELHSYNYILNQLGKRILPQYFYEQNPEEMVKWQNQICRQSHVIAAYLLNKWLNPDGELNYNIEFCESIFQDHVTQEIYDHSWVYVENIYDIDDSYICDIARVSEHIGFVKAGSNTPDIFINDDEYPERRQKPSWETLMEEPEYYTKKKGSEFMKDIEERLKLNRLWIT